MYSWQHVLAAAYTILDELPQLLGVDAERVSDALTEILSRGETEDAADEVLELLMADERTRRRAHELLPSEESTKLSTVASEDYVTVAVYYGTDRKRTSSDPDMVAYGYERAATTELGVCEVSIPRDRRMGELPGPSIWRFEFRDNPAKHVVLQSVRALDETAFFSGITADLAGSRRRELLVFVHGFNVQFGAAARRAAQIAYDVDFDGVPVLYSWPSRGKLSLAGYRHDAVNADYAAAHLRQFLEMLAARSGAAAINVIAHSMGNRALTNALREVSQSLQSPTPIAELILTAADVDAGLFAQIADRVGRNARHSTLYVSENDVALKFSKQYQGDFPRLGDSGAGALVLPGFDTIDVSAVDSSLVGHFFYGDNRSVLSDMYYLLRDKKSPNERSGMAERLTDNGRCWVFQP